MWKRGNAVLQDFMYKLQTDMKVLTENPKASFPMQERSKQEPVILHPSVRRPYFLRPGVF